MRGEVRKRRIVGFAIVHQDFALAADAKMLVGALGRVRHGHEGDVRIGKGIGCFAGKWWMLACLSTLRILQSLLFQLCYQGPYSHVPT